jgi:3D (Asp-Asp-Asp) domain-containing protein
LILVVLVCGYVFGKRIKTAEAAATSPGGYTGSSQPSPARSDRETVPGDVALGEPSAESDSGLLEFDATAYSVAGYTAAGIVAHKGTIAADPRILPLGSVVHIRAGDYSGTYLVLDTGPRIKGRKIDIFMPDRREAISFGRRSVRLKVLGRVRPSHLQPK